MKTIKKHLLLFIFSIAISSFLSIDVAAHCEVPCGIYGDSLRINLLYEHIETIEKSMIKIKELEGNDKINYNQLVRWVNNKEQHAQEVQDIVSQYFLHQRIKIKDISDEEAYKEYINQLTLLHQVLVYAMKSKQTTDQVYIEKLRETLHSFEHAYFD